jgi:nitroreductase
MSTMTIAGLLEQLRWRYAVKGFDPARKIPADTWKSMEEALVLSPSSYGLQPWRFLVVDDAAVRAKLRLVSWNQAQVTDASHYVVFAAKDHVAETDVDRFVARTAEVRGVPAEALAPLRKMMIGDLVQGPRSKVIAEWAARQTYIALGNFMTSAAALGIDTCPMEGLDPQKYDEILSLGGSGFHTVVACAAGYRSEADKYARALKVRYPLEDVVRHV